MRSLPAKLTLLIFSCTLTTQIVQAQSLTIGFKLGPTFANIDADDPDTREERSSAFGGGGFLRFGLGDLSMQPELLVISKGAEVFETTGPDAVELKLDYLEMPIMFRFGIGAGRFRPYLMVGPVLSFELNCTFDSVEGGGEASTDCDDEEADTFDRRKVDFGAGASAGFEFALGPGSILLEGRYTHGLTDIDQSSDVEVRNRFYAILAGYSISLGR